MCATCSKLYAKHFWRYARKSCIITVAGSGSSQSKEKARHSISHFLIAFLAWAEPEVAGLMRICHVAISGKFSVVVTHDYGLALHLAGDTLEPAAA